MTESKKTREIVLKLIAILDILAEVDWTPESMLYIFVGSDMQEWEFYKGILLIQNWVEIHPNHSVWITTAGRAKQKEIQGMIAGATNIMRKEKES